MKREELLALGISEENVEKIMAGYGKDIQAINAKHEAEIGKYKPGAEKAASLQKQLDEIANQNLTEVEKANKATEDANNRVAALEKQLLEMQTRTGLAEQGITGENADKLIASLSSGQFDAALLGQIISEREKAAVSNFEKAALAGTPNPNGSGDGGKTKTVAEEVVEGIAAKKAESAKTTDNIMSAYIPQN